MNMKQRKPDLGKLSTADLVDKFAKLSVDRHSAMIGFDPKTYNRLGDVLGDIAQELKSRGLQDRQALLSLFKHPHAAVWSDAAKAVLGFAPEQAIFVLEFLAGCDHWLLKANAAMVLEMYRKGEWRPD
jgi:hypothetical protein